MLYDISIGRFTEKFIENKILGKVFGSGLPGKVIVERLNCLRKKPKKWPNFLEKRPNYGLLILNVYLTIILKRDFLN